MGSENKHYSNGKKKLVVEYKGWKICPLICYDLRFPVWSRNADGYHVLIYVANWPSQRSFAWNTLLRARAIENQCYVTGVNRVGKDGNETEYIGESQILNPKGFNVKTVETNNGDILTAVLDMDILTDQRKRFPVLKDADTFRII